MDGGSLEWPVAAKEIFISFELLSVLFAEFLRSPLGFISRSIVIQPLFFLFFSLFFYLPLNEKDSTLSCPSDAVLSSG